MLGAQALEHGTYVHGRALAQVLVTGFDPLSGRVPPDLEEMAQEVPLGVDLGGRAQRHDPVLRLDQVHIESAVVPRLQLAVVEQPLHEVDGAQLLQEARVEGDLVHPVEDLPRRARRALALHRIDLNDDDVVRTAGAVEGEDHGVAHVAAVPIGHAADLDRLEHEGETRRCHHHLAGELVAVENLDAPGLDVGRRNEDFNLVAAPHQVEVDHVVQDLLQRIEVERVDVVG